MSTPCLINHCPNCNKEFDDGTAVFWLANPKARDITMCDFCNTPLEFNEDLKLIRIRPETLEALPRILKEYINHIIPSQ